MFLLMRQLPDGFKPFEPGVPLFLDCVFYMPIVKGTSQKKRKQMLAGEIIHTKKPDKDNLEKFVMDCCNGVVWHDDSQVAHGRQRKLFAENPRTLFFVNVLN